MRKLYFHAKKEQISLLKGICLKDSMPEKDLKAARTVPKKIFNFSKSLPALVIFCFCFVFNNSHPKGYEVAFISERYFQWVWNSRLMGLFASVL